MVPQGRNPVVTSSRTFLPAPNVEGERFPIRCIGIVVIRRDKPLTIEFEFEGIDSIIVGGALMLTVSARRASAV